MAKRVFSLFIVTCLWLALSVLPMCGQTSDAGTITSIVHDSSGAAVNNATVTVTSDSTGIAVRSTPRGDGSYVSPPLHAGSYAVRVEATGFKTGASQVTVEVNQQASLQFDLAVGNATETVTVEASAPLIDPDSSTVGQVQNEKAVADLPLNTRNFNQLIGLSTGAVPGNTQLTGALPITVGRGTTANQVNGIGFRSNNYRVDGLDNSENHNSQGILLYPPVEAIQEFRVQSSVPNAEFGHGGASISVDYKTGGKQFHGDVFEFIRNAEYFDAKNYFDPAGPIPPFHYNNYGVTVGGPVLFPHFNRNRDKLFFFFSWEGGRRSQSLTYTSTVPLPAFYTGDFSAYSQTIYDPRTTTVLPNGKVSRTAFPGNKISPGLINATGQNLIKLFPQPQTTALVNNYTSNPAATDKRDYFDLRLDSPITTKDAVFFRISHQNTTIYTPGSLPAPAIGNALGNTVEYPVWQVASGYTRTIRPTLINEVRAGFSRLNNRAFNGNYGNDVSAQVGIPGVNVPGQILTSGLTEIDLSGYATLGDSGYYPAVIANNNFQFNDAVTWIRGKHTLKFGGEILRRQENVYQASTLHGDMGFGPTYTTNPAAGGASGNSLADLLLGTPTSGNIQYISGTSGKRRTDFGFFAQDTWKVTPQLTLNLGLRWDAFPQYPWTEVLDRMSYFQTSLGGLYNVNTPQIPWRSGAQPRYDNFGPRVGFAYAPNPKTILRGAFGIFYSPDIGVTIGNVNPPFAGSVTFANDAGNFSGAHLVSDGFTRPVGNTFPSAGAALTGIDPHLKIPTAGQVNLGIEQSLPSHVLMTLQYVGTGGRSLILQPDVNQPRPGPGAVAARRPYPTFSTISTVEGVSSSSYHSLQATAEKRLVKNLQFLASYTWSHALDYGPFVGAPQNTLDIASEYGNSEYNVPQKFTLSAIFVSPFGRGRRFGSSMPAVLDAIVGGWQLSTITNFYSGLPFTPTSSVNTLNGSGAQRANRLGSGILPSGQQSIKKWFDTSAFAIPGQYQFGNSRRNILRGPATRTSDVSLSKTFGLEKIHLKDFQLRADVFNLANTPQFNNPNASIGGPAAGIISSAGSPITFQRTSRQMQLSGKIHF